METKFKLDPARVSYSLHLLISPRPMYGAGQDPDLVAASACLRAARQQRCCGAPPSCRCCVCHVRLLLCSRITAAADSLAATVQLSS